MTLNNFIESVKKGWHWIWNSDSILSWFVALFIIFIFVKFIFFPVLSFVMGTQLPLAGVESSSMDHHITLDSINRLSLCGKSFAEKESINFDKYWDICGGWYEDREISKEEFSSFPLKNGFRKGDIIIVWGRFTPKVGDIVIFTPNIESNAPRPIIHRIVNIENGIIQTKGDHNSDQLTLNQNNIYSTDETNIKEEQLIGKAIFKIPYLGWIKIGTIELINKIF